MVIDDHVNMPGMAGFSPLRGDNDERWGPRFPPLNNAYCMDRSASLLKCADEINIGQVWIAIYGLSSFTTFALRSAATGLMSVSCWSLRFAIVGAHVCYMLPY